MAQVPTEPAGLPAAFASMDFEAQVATYEMQLIDTALAANHGHQGQTAEALGLSYHQLRGLLKKHGYGKGAGKPNPDETPLRGDRPIPSM